MGIGRETSCRLPTQSVYQCPRTLDKANDEAVPTGAANYIWIAQSFFAKFLQRTSKTARPERRKTRG
jgi:hypothetical protein